jgi:hypothetical protein
MLILCEIERVAGQ